jgi:hypothetical protein
MTFDYMTKKNYGGKRYGLQKSDLKFYGMQ